MEEGAAGDALDFEVAVVWALASRSALRYLRFLHRPVLVNPFKFCDRIDN